MSVDEVRRCRHCRVEVQRIDYVLGPSWMHTPGGNRSAGVAYESCRLTVAEPEETMLERIVRTTLEATSLPPLPDRVKVAPDVLEQLKAHAREAATASPSWSPPAIGSLFGIPVEVDEDLAPGEFRVEPEGWDRR
jgi:hypothetical protein